MRLVKFQIQNFQSFSDSGEIDFADGFNLIIGQNNAGNSALLRAMLPGLPDIRHRTAELWKDTHLPHPLASFTFEISGAELSELVLVHQGKHAIPTPPGRPDEEIAPFVDQLLTNPVLTIAGTFMTGDVFRSTYPSHGEFEPSNAGQQRCVILSNVGGEAQRTVQHNADDGVANLVWQGWCSDMFYFAPERMTVGESAPGHGGRLTPNANNLPNVIHTLQNERGDVFDKLVRHLREIFPTVGHLSVRSNPEKGNVFEIRVWPTETRSEVELSFPLNSSGTGVAQVIAILAAIMTVRSGVILIDEINSFLHPAAIKALLRILQTEYAHHQYIVSTHAPEVIGFSNPKTVHLVRRDGYDSTVNRLDLGHVNQFREVAEHLGVSMADVFAAERVIWVEGPTEELCFPYLYQEMTGQPLPKGTIFSSVAATGDFNRKRDRQIVYEVYGRLCSAAASLVVSVLFSFDTEELSETDKAQMEKDAHGRLHFLPRRHIECYLLDPAAIAQMIGEKDPAFEAPVTADAVADALKAWAGDAKFKIPTWRGDLEDETWLAGVDAARLIGRVTEELSEQRAHFSKKEDSLGLLQAILRTTPDRLTPLRAYVESLVTHVCEHWQDVAQAGIR